MKLLPDLAGPPHEGAPPLFSLWPTPGMPVSRPDVIRVVLADDHLVVRAGLKALLATNRDIEVVGEAANGQEALALIERLKPDVAVLDLDMPLLDGMSTTKELVKRESPTRVLILTMHSEDEYLVLL